MYFIQHPIIFCSRDICILSNFKCTQHATVLYHQFTINITVVYKKYYFKVQDNLLYYTLHNKVDTGVSYLNLH